MAIKELGENWALKLHSEVFKASIWFIEILDI